MDANQIISQDFTFTLTGIVDTMTVKMSQKGTEYTYMLLIANSAGGFKKKQSLFIFGKLHDELRNIGVHEGSLVQVTGELSNKKDQNGRWSLSLWPKAIQILGGASPIKTTNPQFTEEVSMEDIPF